MSKRTVTAAIMWVVALYSAGAFAVIFNGEPASGGPPKGYADDISCQRNWWAFGIVWDCTATIVAYDGKRDQYRSDNSILTPADIGKKVPMTTNRVRRSRITEEKWGPVTLVKSNTVGHVLGVLGIPAAAAVVTYLMYRKRKPDTAAQQTDQLDPEFRR